MSSPNSLNFDETLPQEVVLGGRVFFIREQSTPVIQKILEISGADTDRAVAGENEAQFAQAMFGNWDEQVRATALMLGTVEGSSEWPETVEHLHEHLNPKRVIAIHQAWWKVNDITAFFARGGRVLMPQTTLQDAQSFEAVKQQVIRDKIEEWIAKEMARVEAQTEAEAPPAAGS